MGYTHYWTVDRSLTDDEMAALGADVKAIVAASSVPVAGWDGTGSPEYGTDDPDDARYVPRIALNGVGSDAHESFVISQHHGWTFCKTAAKPYDVIVTASLLALRDRLGDAVHLSSDGDVPDWAPGRLLAEVTLGRPIAPYMEDES